MKMTWKILNENFKMKFSNDSLFEMKLFSFIFVFFLGILVNKPFVVFELERNQLKRTAFCDFFSVTQHLLF